MRVAPARGVFSGTFPRFRRRKSRYGRQKRVLTAASSQKTDLLMVPFPPSGILEQDNGTEASDRRTIGVAHRLALLIAPRNPYQVIQRLAGGNPLA